MFSLCFELFVILIISRFRWVLIASVPGLCIRFTQTINNLSDSPISYAEVTNKCVSEFTSLKRNKKAMIKNWGKPLVNILSCLLGCPNILFVTGIFVI